MSLMAFAGFIALPIGAMNEFSERWPRAPVLFKIAVFAIVFVSWGTLMFGLRWLTGFPYWFRWLGL